MAGMIVSATVLILTVLILRRITIGRISMGMRYALWLAVALRMLLPVSFGSSSVSVLNLVQTDTDFVGSVETEAASQQKYADSQFFGGTGEERDVRNVNLPDTAGAYENDNFKTTVTTVRMDTMNQGAVTDDKAGNTEGMQTKRTDLRYVLLIIWLVGAVAAGVCMVIGQARLLHHLSKTRKKVSENLLPDCWVKCLEKQRLWVYTVAGLPSPCIAGKRIYITPELLEDQEQLSHVLAHEYSHAVLKDTIWAFLRSALCAVYWFYPLVWVAVYEAKQDSELAADERAIRLLGEEKRYAYGRTLLSFLSGHNRSRCAGVVVTMNGSGKRMKNRVSMIAEKKNKSSIMAGMALLIMLLAGGCAFTGAEGKEVAATAESGRLTGQERMDVTAENNSLAGQEGTDATAQNDSLARREEALEKDMETIAAGAFQEMLAGTDDTGLASASTIELTEYYAYLNQEKSNPLEDGRWYLLHKEEMYGIEFYGLFTEKFGCRGIKTLIDGDVNSFDIPWVVSAFCIKVMMLEQAEDGMPRSFAFQVCAENTGRSEVWNLYLADRYDTGTIELYSFEEEAWQEQFKTTKFEVDENTSKVFVNGSFTHNESGQTPNAIDISDYQGYKVEKAVWNDATIGFRFDPVSDNISDSTITFMTTVGLKLAGEEEIQSSGLFLIECPVTVEGAFGDRRCVLGAPVVSEKNVCSMLRTVP